ncbi:hypothetical protein, partial [Sphingomonas sp. VNH70]|uniref:hypothetical protein n=1 Tax=Sphingomonas silueang TaxID=3156617 RepID=UPI0032B54982
VIQHHPYRSLADLGRKLVRRLAHTGSTFSGVGASDKPGAVHDHRPEAAQADVNDVPMEPKAVHSTDT